MAGAASRENGKRGGRPKGTISRRTRLTRAAQSRALEQAEITAERTMLEIGRIAFTDRRGPWRDGHLKPLDEWTDDEAACLEGLEIVIKNAEAGDGHTDTVHKVRLAKKDAALNLLARHFGLISDKLKLEGKVTLEQIVAASVDGAGS